jgi:hypothetical protein
MRNVIIAVIATVLLAGLAWAPSIITNFNAESAGDYVILTWNSGSEASLMLYAVERSLDGMDFVQLAEVDPQGSNSSYTYEDHDLFKGTSRTYYYRIRAQMDNGTAGYSTVQSVTLSFSGIQQTWGSIKSLFR